MRYCAAILGLVAIAAASNEDVSKCLSAFDAKESGGPICPAVATLDRCLADATADMSQGASLVKLALKTAETARDDNNCKIEAFPPRIGVKNNKLRMEVDAESDIVLSRYRKEEARLTCTVQHTRAQNKTDAFA